VPDATRSANQIDKCHVSGLEVFTDWPDSKHFSMCALGFRCKHTIKSFIPESVTNFNENVTCGPGQTKYGALCYENNP